MNGTKFVGLTLKLNVVLALAVLVLAWFAGAWDSVLGAVGGALLGIANFLAIAWSVRRLLAAVETGLKPAEGLLLTLKFGVMLALVYVAIYQMGLDALGFSLGFGSTVLALLVAAVVSSTGAEIKENGSGN